MKVTAERIPESKVLLRIEIPPEQVEQAIEKTYRDLSRRVRVPGFRPGKAPRTLVERILGGPDTVQREGIDRLIDDSFRQALRETDTHPVGEPDISERPEFHPGEPMVIEATVPVAPRVELGDYEAIRLEPVAVEATPLQVTQFIDDLVEANAEWVPVERGIRDHDRATIDVVGIAGTVPVLYGPGGETLVQSEGGTEVFNVTGHEHDVDVQGPVEFAPGFDEELIGLMAGSEKRFGLTLPVDFADASLASQSIVFTVKVHEVREKHLPELNEELAKKVGGGETVEELRESVRARLQARLERDARVMYENSLVEAVVNRSTIEVPEIMIENQIDSEIEDLKADLTREKIPWSDYLEQTSKTEAQVRDELREPALRRLRSYLVLRELARRENIQVLPAEVTAEIEATAAQFGRARSVVRERLSTRDQRERIEFRIFYAKAVNRLAEIAQQPRVDQLSTPESAVETAETGSENAAGESPAPEAAPSSEAGSVEGRPAEAPNEQSAETEPVERTNEETLTHG